MANGTIAEVFYMTEGEWLFLLYIIKENHMLSLLNAAVPQAEAVKAFEWLT